MKNVQKKKKPIKDFFFKIKLKLWELISIEIEIKFKRQLET